MLKLLVLIALILGSFTINAKIHTEKVTYKSGENTFEGFLAFDDHLKGKLPGIVIFHNWLGVTAETESKAIEFAKLGMVAFAGDIFGKGIRPSAPKEAMELVAKYKTDRNLLRDRALIAFNQLKLQKNVNSKKLLAAGYCFGGTTALELSRTGADLIGLFSFHGGLSNPTSNDAKNMKGKTFVFHGGIDPYVPKEEVDLFLKEMNDAKVNYQFVSYSNAVHSFTEKAAGNDNTKGAAYNEEADKNSFEIASNFIHSLKK
jgi:dienelactone hydrolase